MADSFINATGTNGTEDTNSTDAISIDEELVNEIRLVRVVTLYDAPFAKYAD